MSCSWFSWSRFVRFYSINFLILAEAATNLFDIPGLYFVPDQLVDNLFPFFLPQYWRYATTYINCISLVYNYPTTLHPLYYQSVNRAIGFISRANVWYTIWFLKDTAFLSCCLIYDRAVHGSLAMVSCIIYFLLSNCGGFSESFRNKQRFRQDFSRITLSIKSILLSFWVVSRQQNLVCGTNLIFTQSEIWIHSFFIEARCSNFDLFSSFIFGKSGKQYCNALVCIFLVSVSRNRGQILERCHLCWIKAQAVWNGCFLSKNLQLFPEPEQLLDLVPNAMVLERQ